jgi:hypothetical protein
MLREILHRLNTNELNDLKGSKVVCKIPLTIPVINMLLRKAIEDNGTLRTIEVTQINGDEITLNIKIGSIKIAGMSFDMIDREVLLKIHPILNPPEFEVKIEILEGIKGIENEILEMLFNTAFKNNTFDFENRSMLIKHSELFDNPTYQFLLKNVTLANIETQEDKLLYHVQLNF